MSSAKAGLVCVTIDGDVREVAAGITVAAALAVSGVRTTRMSVSSQSRGPLCGMGVCQECRVTVDGRAHVLACQTLCRDGQTIETKGSR
jgi:predicted molibdopterin-dependent oxidoreductase YjgC